MSDKNIRSLKKVFIAIPGAVVEEATRLAGRCNESLVVVIRRRLAVPPRAGVSVELPFELSGVVEVPLNPSKPGPMWVVPLGERVFRYGKVRLLTDALTTDLRRARVFVDGYLVFKLEERKATLTDEEPTHVLYYVYAPALRGEELVYFNVRVEGGTPLWQREARNLSSAVWAGVIPLGSKVTYCYAIKQSRGSRQQCAEQEIAVPMPPERKLDLARFLDW